MVRLAVSRFLAAVLILLMIGGGGSLPALDGLLFHGRASASDGLRPHVEASSGCHADRCAILSTAQQSRYLPVFPVPRLLTPALYPVELVSVQFDLRSSPSTGQPFSRAPPALLPG